jgi:hypothetical protein
MCKVFRVKICVWSIEKNIEIDFSGKLNAGKFFPENP